MNPIDRELTNGMGSVQRESCCALRVRPGRMNVAPRTWLHHPSGLCPQHIAFPSPCELGQYCVAIHGKPPYEIVDANPCWYEEWTEGHIIRPKVKHFFCPETVADLFIACVKALQSTLHRHSYRREYVPQVRVQMKARNGSTVARLPKGLLIGGMVNEPVA